MLVGVAVAVTEVPVPDKGTGCGLPAALSVTVMLPDLAPDTVGVNVTLMVQNRVVPRLAGQLLDCEKSPEDAILEMVSDEVPLLVNVTACGELGVPMF